MRGEKKEEKVQTRDEGAWDVVEKAATAQGVMVAF